MVGEVEVIEGIENWGTTEITVTTVDSVITFTVDGTEYTADSSGVTPAINEWVPILYHKRDDSDGWEFVCLDDGTAISWLRQGGTRHFLVWRGASTDNYVKLAEWNFMADQSIEISQYEDVEITFIGENMAFEINGKQIIVDTQEYQLNTTPANLT